MSEWLDPMHTVPENFVVHNEMFYRSHRQNDHLPYYPVCTQSDSPQSSEHGSMPEPADTLKELSNAPKAARRPRSCSDSACRSRDIALNSRRNLIYKTTENGVRKQRRRANSSDAANGILWRPYAFLIPNQSESMDSTAIKPSVGRSILGSTVSDDSLCKGVAPGIEALDPEVADQLQKLSLRTDSSSNTQFSNTASANFTQLPRRTNGNAIAHILNNAGTSKELRVKAVRLVQEILVAVRVKRQTSRVENC